MKYQPPYTITPEILNRVAAISEAIGRLTVLTDQARALRLRRINRIRTIHGSLAIEGNTLSEAQITAILEGKRVIAPPADRVPHLMSDLFGWLAAFFAPPANSTGERPTIHATDRGKLQRIDVGGRQ